jgi:hypothetical protein
MRDVAAALASTHGVVHTAGLVCSRVAPFWASGASPAARVSRGPFLDYRLPASIEARSFRLGLDPLQRTHHLRTTRLRQPGRLPWVFPAPSNGTARTSPMLE